MTFEKHLELNNIDKINAFLKKNGLTYKDIINFCFEPSSNQQKAERILCCIYCLKTHYSAQVIGDIRKEIYDKMAEIFKVYVEQLEKEFARIVLQCPIQEQNDLKMKLDNSKDMWKNKELHESWKKWQVFFNDAGEFCNPEKFVKAGVLSKIVVQENIVLAYTSPIEKEVKTRIAELAEKNRNGQIEYDDFDFYLSVILDFAEKLREYSKVIDYFQWVILEAKKRETYFDYLGESVDFKEAKKLSGLKQFLQAEIDSMKNARVLKITDEVRPEMVSEKPAIQWMGSERQLAWLIEQLAAQGYISQDKKWSLAASHIVNREGKQFDANSLNSKAAEFRECKENELPLPNQRIQDIVKKIPPEKP